MENQETNSGKTAGTKTIGKEISEIEACLFFEKAILICMDTRPRSSRLQVLEDLRHGQTWAHSTLRYNIALTVSDFLAKYEDTLVKRVYLYGSCADNRSGLSSDIDMVIHVQKKSKDFELLLKKINSVFSEYYVRLIKTEIAFGESFFFDFKVVDDEDLVRNDTLGARVINNSPREPISQIWPRDY